MAIRGGQGSMPPSTIHAVSVQLPRAGICSPERGQEGKSTVWGEGCDVPNKCRAADAADPWVEQSEIEDLRSCLHPMNCVPDGYSALDKEEIQVGFV